MKNTRTTYLRDDFRNPLGCVVIAVDRRNHRATYQVSTYNPHDAADHLPYKRKDGRKTALERLETNPIRVPLPRNIDVTMHDITYAVMKHLMNSKAPARARKAAKYWVQDFQELYMEFQHASVQ